MAIDTRESSEKNIISMIDLAGEELESLSVRYKENVWNTLVGQPAPDLPKLEEQLLHAMTNAEWLSYLKTHRANDTLLSRRMHIMRLEVERTMIERNELVVDVQQAITLSLNSPEVFKLHHILNHDSRRDQRRLALKKLGETAESLRSLLVTLVLRRQEAAREIGYRHYGELYQHIIEATVDDVIKTCEPSLQSSAPIFQSWREASEKTFDGFEHHDFQYATTLAQRFPYDEKFKPETINVLILSVLDEMGFSDLPVSTYDAGTQFPSMCFPIRVPSDVRLFMSTKTGYETYRLLLKEFGKAFYYASVAQDPYEFKTPNSVMIETCANIFLRLMTTKEKLTRIGLSSSEVEGALAYEEKIRAIERFTLVTLVKFERGLYESEERQLNDLWTTLYHDGLSIEGTITPDWPLQSIFVASPFKAAEYLLSATLAEKIVGPLTVLSVAEQGESLRQNVYSYGNSRSWKEIIKFFN
ncbi:hypothetical protein K1X84_00355 [bacterium]|nr:hypothetical protein [bacterium]